MVYQSFNINFAKVYGLAEAIIFDNIVFWTSKNRANKRHFINGRYWTYNTGQALSALFPYLTEYQISKALKHLENENLILIDNFNKQKTDRTRWFALSDFAISILRNQEMDFLKSKNGFCENKECKDISNILNISNTYNYQDNTHIQERNIKERSKKSFYSDER